MGARSLSNLKQEKGEQVTLFALEVEKTDTHSNAWAPCTGVLSSHITDQYVWKALKNP